MTPEEMDEIIADWSAPRDDQRPFLTFEHHLECPCSDCVAAFKQAADEEGA